MAYKRDPALYYRTCPVCGMFVGRGAGGRLAWHSGCPGSSVLWSNAPPLR